MSKNKPEKNNFCLETAFRDVLVCKNNSLRPYIEIFIQAPENIANQNLGTIAGILQITDESEDSSYIVNYITSVIKKEYFQKSKRGSIESFEAALNKVNLALAKLAEHGSISWVGKINAAVLVVEKNNIHLSLSGAARALLLRKSTLTDIGESSPKGEVPNPLKTFVDVVSGRIEKNDKFIITTEHIFEVFSLEELRRSALKFSTSEFIQFLKTALGNEIELSAVLFIEALEKEKKSNLVLCEKPNEEIKEDKVNAFSQTAFSKKAEATQKNEVKLKPEDQKIILDEAKDKPAPKNGHLYIKEDSFVQNEESVWDKITDILALHFQNLISLISKIKNFSPSVASSSNRAKNELPEKIAENFQLVKNIFFKITRFLFLATQKAIQKITFFWQENKVKLTRRKKEANAFSVKDQPKIILEIAKISQKIKPDFLAIKNIFTRLDKREKIIAFAALFLLLVMPYFISKIGTKEIEEIKETEKIEEAIAPPLENDKSVKRVENTSQAALDAPIVRLILLNDKVFALSPAGITDIERKEVQPFPENFSDFKTAAPMDDLNLIFILDSQNRVFSWSPTTQKFEENQFSVPENANLDYAQTFLTYLLVADKNNDQIYRYPRTNGGFSEKNNRLNETLDLERMVDMAVGENIFLAEKNSISKFFQGKREAFEIEKTETPVLVDKIYTREGNSHLYVLDKQNSRILKLDLSGQIMTQFYNPEISSASDFAVFEEKNIAYFSSGAVLHNFQMD